MVVHQPPTPLGASGAADSLGLKQFACGTSPALARGAAGAEQMASSVLSFLKSSTSSAGQEVTAKVNLDAADAADTRDQPEIEGTSLDYACMYGDERP